MHHIVPELQTLLLYAPCYSSVVCGGGCPASEPEGIFSLEGRGQRGSYNTVWICEQFEEGEQRLLRVSQKRPFLQCIKQVVEWCNK